MVKKWWVQCVAAGCGLLLTGVLAGLLIADIAARQSNEPDVSTGQSARSYVVVAAGDIACDATQVVTQFACRQADTAALVKTINPDAVITLGDNQYPSGSAASYANSYDKAWGAFKDKTHPTPGNHDYGTSGAAGYYSYFGAQAGEAGKGYYSFKVGDWLFVALNSEIDISATSAQMTWLHQVLTADTSPCTAAYWHKPRFSSGGHASDVTFDALWRELYANKVDVVLNGHSHSYERFAPQNPDGAIDAKQGITQFVSGMGGYGVEPLQNPLPNTATRQNHAFGVLKLTLMADRMDYSFVAAPNTQQFRDAGTIYCH